MKFEEIISSFVMVIVTGLVLVGFTIAWYTNNNLPAVTGIEVLAAEMGSVQVALKPEAEGGVDISKLEGAAKYAELGMAEYANFSQQDKGELAPGVSGQVTFYVKPITSAVKSCNIVPMVRISQDGSTWYPVIESVDGSSEAEGESGSVGESGEASGESGGTDESSESSSESGSSDGSTEFGAGDDTTGTGEESGSGENGEESGSSNESSETGGSDGTGSAAEVPTIEELYALTNAHIEFFKDAAMTEKITEDNPCQLAWGTAEFPLETEQPVTIYWKWHYEYPFTANDASLSDAEKEALIDTYDEEDMTIGNNISKMKFYFTFSAQ